MSSKKSTENVDYGKKCDGNGWKINNNINSD